MMSQRKVLVAGNWRSKIHEEALSDAFENLDCDVTRFEWNSYFTCNAGKKSWLNIFSKIEYRLSFGLTVLKINRDLVRTAVKVSPNILFIYRPILISKKTINKIKSKCPNIIIASYNNDDPFSQKYSWQHWLRFKRSISSYDVIFSYRPSNINNYKKYGARIVHLLPPWFIKNINHFVTLSPTEMLEYKSDIVFIGHYEDDGRIDVIKKLVIEGFDVSLFGPDWNKVIENDSILGKFFPVKYLYGNEYNMALCGSKMALVIYSSLNSDVYTRRCFEIPATKTMMIAQRSSEMLELYKEDVECVYFSNIDELIKKVNHYIKHESARKQVSLNGYNRAINSEYEVIGRATYILKMIDKIKA